MQGTLIKKYDIESMSITDIKSKIEELQNKLDFFLQKKEQAFLLTQPKTNKLKEVSVEGGKRVNLYDKYVMTSEELDPVIDFLQDEMKLLEDFLNKELERIDKYDEWEQKVIYLREEGKTWLYIACNTPFSIRTCQRIYRRYTNKRSVDEKKD